MDSGEVKRIACDLGADLCGAHLEPDSPLEGNLCEEACSRCIDNCSAGAFSGPEVYQTVCKSYAFYTEPGEEFTFKCHICRTICLHCLGSKNGSGQVGEL